MKRVTASAYRVIPNVNFDFDNQQPKEPAYVWNKNAADGQNKL